MRRNESAAAALQSLGAGEAEGSGGGAGERGGGRLPKNKSFAVLHQLRAREAEQPQTEASRSLVCEACAMHLEAPVLPPLSSPAASLLSAAGFSPPCRLSPHCRLSRRCRR